MFVLALKIALGIIVGIIVVYTIRHYIFTLNRLFGVQRHPYIDIDTATWPTLTVFVPAHNEEQVIGYALQALVNCYYPPDKLQVLVVNDRSTDRTAEIVDEYVERYPHLIKAFHRSEGRAGKSAALKEVSRTVTSDIILIFDADYIPGRGLLKQLVAPFFDPEVGGVMGRVVPINTGRNLLTRLIDLERAGGYQVDQQARMNMGLVPQFGGTVGGVRRVALESIGGWRDNTLAEDTNLTYRLLLKGWKTVYQNRSECYEESPENWTVRNRQISRWSIGHNQAMLQFIVPLLFSSRVRFGEKLDGLLLLGVYMMSPLLLIGWVIAILLFYMGENNLMNGPLILLAVAAYGAAGNSAAFFEICAAVYLDRMGNRLRLLPFNFFNFLISMMVVSQASFGLAFNYRKRDTIPWNKTPRFRQVLTL